MALWSLCVSSTYLATREQVFALKTDPIHLNAELGRYLNLWVADPNALMHALRGDAPQRFAARLTGPLGLIGLPWPMSIDASNPPHGYQDSSVNLLYRTFEHTHRVVTSGPDRVHYIDEVRFTPRLRPSIIVAKLTQQLFGDRHQFAATVLPIDAVEGTRSTLERCAAPVHRAVHA